MATAIVPGIYDATLADEDIGVSTEEAFSLTRRLAQEGPVRRHLERRQSGRRAECRAPDLRCRGRRRVLRWRREVSVRAPLGRVRRGGALMALSLQAGVAEAIRAHGSETYPNECCGALYGRDGVVTATFALPNTTEEGPRRRFLVRPQDYRDAERRATGAEGRSARLLSLAPGSSGASRPSTISTTPGRFSRTSSLPSAPARPRT